MTSLSSVRGIIFDKDGTLFDFEKSWSRWTRRFLLRYCKGDARRATAVGFKLGFDFAGCRFNADSRIIAGTPDDIVAVLEAEFPRLTRQFILEDLIASSRTAVQVETVDLTALMTELRKRGFALGVATNDSVRIATEHLRMAAVLQFFDFVAGYDSGYGAKPDPTMLLAFCNDSGIDASQTLMVGDSLFDLLAGCRAGMRTVGVLTGMAEAAELAPYADLVLADIGELPSVLYGS